MYIYLYYIYLFVYNVYKHGVYQYLRIHTKGFGTKRWSQAPALSAHHMAVRKGVRKGVRKAVRRAKLA